MIKEMVWKREAAGLWRSGLWMAANHPRVYPRGWQLSYDGHSVRFCRSLTAAKSHARRVVAGQETLRYYDGS